MLDATAITNPDDYTREDFRPGLVIRRFKKDVQEQVRETFKDRTVHPRRFPSSAAEEAAFDALLAVRLVEHRPDAPTRDLFTVTLEKALFSSPAACIETVDERIATLDWLKARLTEDLHLEPGRVETLHGGMSDVDQQRVVEDFGNTRRPVRLLICSDVASEGINLHYQCHRLIHFDMPWSLMVFQQRNGRVDRYGQNATPQIVYLVTESGNPTIRGDVRILEVLMKKDEQAYKNIGDPSVFMDVHDIDEEEEITRRAVAGGESDVDFDRRLTPEPSEGESLLSMFLQPKTGEATARPAAAPPPPLSLFGSELDYCAAALHRLRAAHAQNGGAGGPAAGSAHMRIRVDQEAEMLTLDAPQDLVARYRYLPPRCFRTAAASS